MRFGETGRTFDDPVAGVAVGTDDDKGHVRLETGRAGWPCPPMRLPAVTSDRHACRCRR